MIMNDSMIRRVAVGTVSTNEEKRNKILEGMNSYPEQEVSE